MDTEETLVAEEQPVEQVKKEEPEVDLWGSLFNLTEQKQMRDLNDDVWGGFDIFS